MKKLILFFASLFLTGVTLYGQTTLFTEGWESAVNNSDIPPAGWAVDVVLGSDVIFFMSQGTFPLVNPFEGSRLADFESATFDGYVNRLKRTIPISTVGYTNITVDFEWYTDNALNGFMDQVIVQWSTDGSTWNNTSSFLRYSPTNQWVLNTVTLPAGAENKPTLYVAFYFESDNGNDCHMDIMHIKSTPTQLSTVPTLSQWGLIILSFLLLSVGTVFILKRQHSLAIIRRDK